MDDNERKKDKGAKSFWSVKEILEFVDELVAVNHKTTTEEEKVCAKIRKYIFEGIKRKRGNPESELFKTAKEILVLFDRIESTPSVITMYQRKKLETDLKIYEQLLIGERERRLEKLSDLKNPVACVEVAAAVRLDPDNRKKPKNERKRPRSDNIARKLRRSGCPVILDGKKFYCEAKDAALIWPEYKKYWKKQKLDE